MAQQRNDPLAAEIQNGLEQLRSQRLDGLDAIGDIHVALQSAIVNEAQRLEGKLGAENTRTLQLKQLALSNIQVTQAVKIENDLTRVVLPDVDDGGALVYGRVVDEDNIGIDRLIVRLVSPSGVLDINDVTTDDSGAFAFSLDTATVDRLIKESPKGIQVAVYTPRGRALYTQAKLVQLAHGARILIPIRLLRQDLMGAPAPPPPTETVVVPNVIDKTEKDAVAALNKAHLKLGNTETIISPSRAGRVIDQTPSAGANVSIDSAVALTIGAAQVEKVEVPDLVGSSVRSARTKLKSAGLALGSISGTSAAETSIIQAQSPAAGSQAPKGSTVDVTVRSPTNKG